MACSCRLNLAGSLLHQLTRSRWDSKRRVWPWEMRQVVQMNLADMDKLSDRKENDVAVSWFGQLGECVSILVGKLHFWKFQYPFLPLETPQTFDNWYIYIYINMLELLDWNTHGWWTWCGQQPRLSLKGLILVFGRGPVGEYIKL